jgi:hypothetical protein
VQTHSPSWRAPSTASVRIAPVTQRRKDVPHRFPNHSRLESMTGDLSRVLATNI